MDGQVWNHDQITVYIDQSAFECSGRWIFDNEEVGSGTKQGAASTFLRDTLQRIHEVLGYDCEDYRIHLANSLMFSADNAHAVHPNHTDL